MKNGTLNVGLGTMQIGSATFSGGALGFDRGGTLAIAGIYLSDIPVLNYERHLFQERQVRSVTSNTRNDAREFLAFAGQHHIDVTSPEYPLGRADQALSDLSEGRIAGAAVLLV